MQGFAYQTKKRSCFSQSNHFELAMGTSHFIITSPSPHTHLSLPLPTINDPLDEILSMNLNLEEHFDNLNLEKPHIAPTPKYTNEPTLKPIETHIGSALPPLFSPSSLT